MKKKIAILLAAAMTLSALPMTAFASSTNSVNKVASVQEDEEIRTSGDLITLKVAPKDEVETGDTIIIDITNGEFDSDLVGEAQYKDWDAFWSYVSAGATLKQAYTRYVYQNDTNALPYRINYLSKSQIEVELCPLAEGYADRDNTSDQLTLGKPVYNIALPAKATDEGDVKISVDSNNTSISDSSSITIAKTTTSGGSTTASVAESEVKSKSDDVIIVPDITVKEDTTNTFPGLEYDLLNDKVIVESGTIRFKVNGKYTWKKYPTLKNGTGYDHKFTLSPSKTTDTYVEFELTGDLFDSEKLSSVILTGGEVEVKDSDKDFGDVTITVSGSSAGITTESIVVAHREDYGFSLTALESAPTIFAGRTPVEVNGKYTDLDEDDFLTAKFRFSETANNTWLDSRKLEFTVPDGVKIIGAKIDKAKYVTGGVSEIESNSVIANTGSSLRISALKGAVDEDEISYIDLALYVTAQAGFTGDVTVTAAGAGLDADKLTPLTVATVVAPVTIETSATKTNLGYQATPTADITITEAAAGAFMDDEYVVIKMDTVYGDQELGFASDDAELTVDGDLEVKDFKVTSGNMKFKIDGESYAGPSTITIKNVQVGTTRSIPYGSYDLLVGGDALVNNYKETVNQKSTIPAESGALKPNDFNDYDDFGLFDTDEGYKFKGYLQVVTETGTLDGKVEVTIGETTMKLDGEDVEMDVAPYIQTSSNSTMVPVRFVALAIGVDSEAVTDADNSSKILWDANTKTCTIIYAAGNGMKIIKFQAGSDQMVIDGTSVTLENGVVAEITDGRMFVPFRALGQALGVTVSWDAETRTAIYNA